ncbi:hypothetical protein ALC60_04083 [Trachymyrmex zeteki]|nr:hypothetical protein ALC60_04083 [Trachymyrmex zeteki]
MVYTYIIIIVYILQIVNKYVRFLIRGKLGRSAPVLLDCKMKNCIDLIIQYLKEANIPERNPYIFALPGYDKKRFKYMRACDLLRTYSIECGASTPLRLRGTKLRKHIATRCITLNLSEPDITQLATYLGHDKNIHMQHYRQSIPQVEILKMSRLLKIAQGEHQDIEQQDIDEDNLQINAEENSLTINEKFQMDNHNNENDSDESCTSSTSNVVKVHKRKRRSSKYTCLYMQAFMLFNM